MEYSFRTKAVHAGQHADPETGAVIPPIHLSSTFRQESVGIHSGFEYSRTNNPTRERTEAQIAALENARHGIAFASGSAATSTIQYLLKSGDHVICGDDVYGGTYRFFDKVMRSFGISYDFVDLTNPDNLTATIRENTKMIWLETPTNPLLKITDLQVLTDVAKSHGVLTVVDNTFATPFLQQPFDYQVDLVVHSATKYLGGHSDLVGGIVLTNREDLAERLRFLQNSAGSVPSPFDCWLLSRGIKTLPLRMIQHSENAAAIADFLREQKGVDRVYYPFLDDHPGSEIAKKQMKMGGGMVSFELSSEQSAKTFLTKLQLFALAESLGGVESLAEYPPEMTHGSIERPRRHEIGINDGLIRLSAGIEDKNDLIADLEHAFKQVNQH